MSGTQPEAPPPNTSLQQSVLGNDNITIGSIGAGASVHVNTGESIGDVLKLLDQARVAQVAGDFKNATAYGSAVLSRLDPNGDSELKTTARFLVGWSAFKWYLQDRDAEILRTQAIPNFVALAKGPALAGTPLERQRGEAEAYLAWCEAYLGNQYAADAHLSVVTADLGSSDQLTHWARRAVQRAKIVEGTKFGVGFTFAYLAYAAIVGLILVFVVFPIIDWLFSS